MILGLGIDLLPNRRLQQELARCEWRPGDGIFSAEEIRHCRSTTRPARRFAACFAAKEATLKALGLRASDLAMFRDIEVVPGTGGVCSIILHGRVRAESEKIGVAHIKLSVSSSASQTGAMVILED